jgi:hypothetical protein
MPKEIPVLPVGKGLKAQLRSLMDRALPYMEKASKRDADMIIYLYNSLRLVSAAVDELVNALPDDEENSTGRSEPS